MESIRTRIGRFFYISFTHSYGTRSNYDQAHLKRGSGPFLKPYESVGVSRQIAWVHQYVCDRRMKVFSIDNTNLAASVVLCVFKIARIC